MKINIVTFGCAKNVVDTEHLAAQLPGAEVVFDSEGEADAVVVNTCGFIADAKQESIDAILAFAQAKEEGRLRHLFVMGCLSQRYRNELSESIPEVDRYFGVDDMAGVVAVLGEEYRRERETQRVLTTPKHYAYLKISEGCNRNCGFCIIPSIRGRHRSVPVETLMEEARELAAGGVKELIVIAQDTTLYGLDLYGERKLGTLLRELCTIEGIRWIRLLYAYPADFPDDVIAAMRDEEKICPYLDIPLQHIADTQLKSMRRATTRRITEDLIEKLRREVPGIALRTTLLTGYPGETEAEHEELLTFVRSARFERLGIFTYSEEEGTYSATELTDDVPPEEKERRAERIMDAQSYISGEYNESRVGTVVEAVIDRREGDFWIARSKWEAPEVDGEILIAVEGKQLKTGEFYNVTITSAEEYDLYGSIC